MTNEWQPIETAPKDGTWVLAWLRVPWAHHELMRWLISPESEPRWQVMGDRWIPGPDEFTHWQPLPPRPR